MKNINLNNQEEYWETNYSSKPKMFGLAPSFAAEEALKVFDSKGLNAIIEEAIIAAHKKSKEIGNN